MAAGKPTVKVIQGATFRRVLRTPWNLNGFTVSAQLRNDHGNGTLEATFTCSLQTNPVTGLLGQVELVLSAEQTSLLSPGQSDLAFDVKFVAANDDVTYSPRVWLNVSDRVTI